MSSPHPSMDDLDLTYYHFLEDGYFTKESFNQLHFAYHRLRLGSPLTSLFPYWRRTKFGGLPLCQNSAAGYSNFYPRSTFYTIHKLLVAISSHILIAYQVLLVVRRLPTYHSVSWLRRWRVLFELPYCKALDARKMDHTFHNFYLGRFLSCNLFYNFPVWSLLYILYTSNLQPFSLAQGTVSSLLDFR